MVDEAPEPDPQSEPDPKNPSFQEMIAAAAQNTSLGKIKPGELPTGRALFSAVGGVRGVLESVLPGVAFLVLYLATGNLIVSVLVPVALALIFVVARVGARQPYTSALAGAIGVAVTAGLALITHSAVTNFVPGIIINTIGVVVLLASLIARWPLIGLIVGLLLNDTEWRSDPAKRRMLTRATWLWVGLFAVRLIAEVPLFLANLIGPLGVVRLITGVPLYAICLWITWLLVSGVYSGSRSADAPSGSEETAD
jgi:hypothetical protein